MSNTEERIADDVHAWAVATPVATAGELRRLATEILAVVAPYEITDHAAAEKVPSDGAVWDGEGVLLQRSSDGTAWFQPGYEHAIETEDITLPAMVVHPWGWRP